MTNQVPELSFKDIEKGDTFSINILKDALSNHGFFSITDHGLSQDLIDRCYACSKDFFDLDFQEKEAYSSVGSKGARGYTPKGIETAVGEKIADQKEFWHHGPVIDDSYDKKIPSNIHINEVPDFNDNFDELYNELHKRKILQRKNFNGINFDLLDIYPTFELLKKDLKGKRKYFMEHSTS